MTASAPQKGFCKGCNLPVVWSQVVDSNRRMPLNPEPDADGNIAFLSRGDRVRVLRAYDLAFMQRNFPHELYTSHFDTCANANDFRSAKQKTKKRFG